MLSVLRVSLSLTVGAVLNASVSGPTVVVWSALDTYAQCCHGAPFHSCPLATTPDIPARAWSDSSTTPPTTRMIVGSTKYCHMSGPSLLNLTRECGIAYNKTADGDPSHYAADEYLDSPVAFDNGTVVALVHTEFPGNRYNESGGPGAPYCTGAAGAKGYPECWTVSVGLVVSHDWGKTFAHAAPPPRHLVAAVPYGYNQSQLAYGWGDPSNILKSPVDGFYYAALWNRHQVGLQKPGLCFMRSNDLMDPRSWRGYDGKGGYTVPFADAYTLAPGTEAQHVCAVSETLPAGSVFDGCAAHGLTYSRHLRKFVVTLGCNQATDANFKVAVSDDMITWSEPAPLDPTVGLDPAIAKYVVGRNYPTFMDPTAPAAFGDRNFGTIGDAPYLLWVSMGHSPTLDGRHLLATPFALTLE